MEDAAPTGGSAAHDAAHTMGTTADAITAKSNLVRKSVEDAGGKTTKGGKSKDPLDPHGKHGSSNQ